MIRTTVRHVDETISTTQRAVPVWRHHVLNRCGDDLNDELVVAEIIEEVGVYWRWAPTLPVMPPARAPLLNLFTGRVGLVLRDLCKRRARVC